MITNLVTLTITAYCNCITICCPSSSKGLTAQGTYPTASKTIAASRSLPFGTRVYIPSLKAWRIVEDRMAKKYDNSRIDVFMKTHKEAIKFGKRVETVTIITLK